MGSFADRPGKEVVNGRKPRIATVWLGGCSGCHMSFLDLDERLIDLAQLADVVFTPIADFKVFPEAVDVTLAAGGAGPVAARSARGQADPGGRGRPAIGG